RCHPDQSPMRARPAWAPYRRRSSSGSADRRRVATKTHLIRPPHTMSWSSLGSRREAEIGSGYLFFFVISLFIPTGAGGGGRSHRRVPVLTHSSSGVEGWGPVLLERESALASLTEYAAQARAGQGRLVLLTGEAGVGKSALLEHLQQTLPE